MREIKFRGKRIDNGQWVYGGFHKHQKYTPSPIIPKGEEPKEPECACLVIESGFSDWNMPKPILGHEVDPATVSQYTGLRDKNGVEIYEGDIVRKGDFISQVKYIAPSFYKVPLDKWSIEHGIEATVVNSGSFVNREVIGNIHDNPELLEEVERLRKENANYKDIVGLSCEEYRIHRETIEQYKEALILACEELVRHAGGSPFADSTWRQHFLAKAKEAE